MDNVWYTTVGTGGNPAPRGPWQSPDEALVHLTDWFDTNQDETSALVAKHNIRIATYPTQEAALRAAQLGDLNDGGYGVVTGFYRFAREHRIEQDDREARGVSPFAAAALGSFGTVAAGLIGWGLFVFVR